MIAALVVLLLFSAGAELKEPEDRPTLARFDLRTLDGKRIKSTDLVGRVAVVSFWATWCVPCKRELAALDAYGREYGERGLVVVAIATDGPETIASVRSTARRKRWKMSVGTDPDGSITSKLNPRGAVPYTIFVDRLGRVARIHPGYKAGDEVRYRTIVETLLAESSP